VVIFERVTLRSRHHTLYGLITSPPKQSALRSGRWNEQTCQLEILPPDALANILNRWIRWYLHLAIFERDRKAEGRKRHHLARAVLWGGGSLL
jgi:hypothetical protein